MRAGSIPLGGMVRGQGANACHGWVDS
jgi:hypothetical protein